MDSERWQNVERLYHATLECEESQRAAFLTRACGGDEALRREVESLVFYGSRTGKFIEGSALEMVAPALAGDEGDEHDPTSDECRMIGKKISQYRIVEQLGRGGMGEVYRAVRADGHYQKQVAIKLVRAGRDSGSVIGRFKNERQILAGLDHPHIARLLDGGATEEGVPYFVMELVEGQPMDQYCDSHKLGIPARLELFLQVCSALAYAHERQIIHRDIKPANILLTEEGVPKLLDFGIAKILDSGVLAGVVGLTQTVFRAFTPKYASPEQIKAAPITIASDVYSLGVLLYELLTGHRPYRLKTRTPAEIEQAICEEEPLKPSTVVTQVEEQTLADGTTTAITPEEVSRARNTDPKQIHSCLLGDLDAIVMMALRKEPHRRYASVHDFSEDIRKHLEGLPINARPSTITYRGTKFVRRHRELAVGTLVFLVLLGGLSIILSHWSQSRASKQKTLTEKDFVVLADFANSTGDAVFDGTLKQALSIALAQSPFLNVLSDSKVSGTLKLMTLPADTPLTQNVAREICQRAGSKAYIAGSIASLGSEYVLGLKAADCQSGDTLAQEQVTAPAKEKLLDALGHAAVKLRGELGESLASVEKYDKPLEEATTSSLEALQALTQGLRTARAKDSSESISSCKRAVELDPNFAMAYACLGMAYNNARDTTLAIQNFKKAYQLRQRASQRERFYIETSLFSMATGQLEKANQTYTDWALAYPRDVAPHNGLNHNYSTMGQYEKAIGEALESIRLRPENVVAYGNLVGDYVNLNRPGEAKRAFEQARAGRLDGGALRVNRYFLAFLQRDDPAMQEQAAWATGKGGLEGLLLSIQSDSEAYYGRFHKARELSERAVEVAEHADDSEGAAAWRALEALREAEIGNMAEARNEAAQALVLSSGRDVEVVAALAFARAGDLAKAQRLADRLNREFPLDTMIQNYFLPTIRAAIELQRSNPGKAIEILKVVMPYEMGGATLGNLYPVYERGQAYLQAGQIQQAIAEFQNIIDRPYIVLNSVWGTLTRLQLARARVRNRDNVSARESYQRFLALWNDADRDIPILKQARVEYSALR